MILFFFLGAVISFLIAVYTLWVELYKEGLDITVSDLLTGLLYTVFSWVGVIYQIIYFLMYKIDYDKVIIKSPLRVKD